MQELGKQYNPAEVEGRLYAFWQSQGYFKATKRAGSKGPYTIVMPPPNITGQLHMGHALDNTLQDILIRWRRMQGYDALWVPGTDHAAIATELKIVEEMASEGLTKADLGYDRFLERAWQWKETYGGRIVQQLRRLGSSCDWSRERFTMDEGCSQAVREVFVRLYEQGRIYRGERMINWCCQCKTSLSDAEVEHNEQQGHFWHIRYPLADGTGHLEVATTRPETLLGDVAVAVHPSDARYAAWVGKELVLPLVGRKIPVVADDYVSMDFGTGCVKITPAHDPNDFELGQRHALPIRTVMDEDGRMNSEAGVYAGLDRYACRKRLVADLEAAGYLVKTEAMQHSVGECYRCHSTAEPRLSTQWFVQMQPLAEPAMQAVQQGQTRFVPERFAKIYYHWMENIRDWCISRQLWWGHRIPAWHCTACGHITVARQDPTACERCGGAVAQDPDTLDTWFSSALWPFSTLGWPHATEDLAYFYPTHTLVTGYDIIFFWVARMLFSACEHTGQVPFAHVLIHGLVRDDQGRKMSKSLGNGVDPLAVIEEYGADALRFALLTGNAPGNDMRFSTEKIRSSRNFANKIWNAARFVQMHLPPNENLSVALPTALEPADQWILTQLHATVTEVTANLEKFELGLAAQKLYDFVWDSYCDWYIELAKPGLQSDRAHDVRQVLVFVLQRILQLLHPFMPFLTEELYQALPGSQETIMLSPWPEADPAWLHPVQEAEMRFVQEVIRAIRNRRAEMNVPPGRRVPLFLQGDAAAVVKAHEGFLQKLAGASLVTVVSGAFATEGMVQIPLAGVCIYIPLHELIDTEAERARLTKELAQTQALLQGVTQKLQNERFVQSAPAAVVQGARENLQRLQEQQAALQESLQTLR